MFREWNKNSFNDLRFASILRIIPVMKEFSRRRFIEITATSLTLPLLSACKPSPYFQNPEKQESIPNTAIANREIKDTGSEALDLSYVSFLLDELQKERGDNLNRPEAILDSLRLIYRGDGWGSTLQIDESGYYLAAHHTVYDKDECAVKDHPHLEVYSPTNQKSEVISSYISHYDDDIAIIYAPSSKPKRPIHNLQLTLTIPGNGSQLWLAGFFKPGNDKNLIRWQLTGSLDTSVYARSTCYPNLVGVRGMIPYGGSSGGPVWDSTGRVVALESSYFPLGVNSRKDYQGAAVQPLNGLLDFKKYTKGQVMIHKNGRYMPS